MIPKHTDFGLQVTIVSHNRPSFTESSQVFARIKAETPRVSEGSCLPSLVFRAVGLSRVLNHEKLMLARKFEDGIHICHLTEQVHRNDGFCPLGEDGRQVCWIHCVGTFFHINENRSGATISDSLRCSHERTWDGDNFVPGTHAAGEENEPKRFSPAAQANGMSAVAVGGEICLKCIDKRASREGAALDHFPDGRFKFDPFGSMVRFEIEEWYFHVSDNLVGGYQDLCRVPSYSCLGGTFLLTPLPAPTILFCHVGHGTENDRAEADRSGLLDEGA